MAHVPGNYHYWFRGKQLLEKPCEQILVSGEPEFPFCFSWANESWTRSWDGSKRSVLMAQDYGTESDWKNHFDYVLPFFKDPRYITYESCPLFLIYRPRLFPELGHMIQCWNQWIGSTCQHVWSRRKYLFAPMIGFGLIC